MRSIVRAKEVIPGYDGLICDHQLAMTNGQYVKDLEFIAKAAAPEDLETPSKCRNSVGNGG